MPETMTLPVEGNTELAVALRDQIAKAASSAVDEKLAKRYKDYDVRNLMDKDGQVKNDAVPTHDELTQSVLATWARNGMTKDIDAQDFNKNPDERLRYKIGFEELVSIVNKVGPKVDQAHGHLHDNIGLPTNAGMLIPRVISRIVREAIEPTLVGLSLLRRIQFSNGETITFPAVGAYTAANLAPGQEYPERSLEFAGVVTARVGKVGVKVRIVDEMLRYSMFDVMSLHLRAGARAMARHKETMIFNMITALGAVIFDNTGGASLRGRTTGRARTRALNYTLTLTDLFTMYADLMNAGFVPNTLLMNPMGWLIFVLSGTLRAFGFMNGRELWGAWGGRPGQAPTWEKGPSAGWGASATPREMSNASLYGQVPSIFPAPLSVVVTPFMPFNATCQTTTVTLCDRNELGFFIEDEALVTESWDDPNRDIRSTKFRERYALALDNEGDAVANARGIAIDRSFDFEDFQVFEQTGTGVLPSGTGWVCT